MSTTHTTDEQFATSLRAIGWDRSDSATPIMRALAILRGRVRESEARIAALEEAMPKRGTWRDNGTWDCVCVHTYWNNARARACPDCGTLRPLPAPVASEATAQRCVSTVGLDHARCEDQSGHEDPHHSGDRTWPSVLSTPVLVATEAPAASESTPAAASDLAARMRAAALAVNDDWGSDGAWSRGVFGSVVDDDGSQVLPCNRQVAYVVVEHVAAACPANVIALCDENEALQVEIGKLRQERVEDEAAASNGMLRLADERDALKAELEQLTATTMAHANDGGSAADVAALKARVADLEHERDSTVAALGAEITRSSRVTIERDALKAEANAYSVPPEYAERIASLVRHWRAEDADLERAKARAMAVGQ